jgi:hypothetical protein
MECKLVAVSVCNPIATIGRSILHDYHLEIPYCLAHQTAQQFIYFLGTIIDRDDDRKLRSLHEMQKYILKEELGS